MTETLKDIPQWLWDRAAEGDEQARRSIIHREGDTQRMNTRTTEAAEPVAEPFKEMTDQAVLAVSNRDKTCLPLHEAMKAAGHLSSEPDAVVELLGGDRVVRQYKPLPAGTYLYLHPDTEARGLLADALAGFEATQKVEDYPSDHWAVRAAAYLKGDTK